MCLKFFFFIGFWKISLYSYLFIYTFKITIQILQHFIAELSSAFLVNFGTSYFNTTDKHTTQWNNKMETCRPAVLNDTLIQIMRIL